MRQISSTHMLLTAIVVSGVTTFMFYPLITLELLERGESELSVGLILGLLSGVGPTSSVFIGQLNAIWGSRALSIGGLILRSAGLMVFAFDSSLIIYVVGAVVASLASGSVALALKTELMRTSTSRKMITLRSIMVNIGALVGPSLGGVLYFLSDFSTIVYLAAASYIGLSLALMTITFQPLETCKNQETSKSESDIPMVNVSFLLLAACALGYWAIYSLWPLVVPIIALEGFGTPVASSWIYTVNAILILALQYWIVVKGLKTVRSTAILALGFSLFVVSFAFIALPILPATVVVFAVLFSLSEMLVSPTLDELTGRLETRKLGLTRAYGVMGTIGGIGSLIGAPIGGFLIQWSGQPKGTLWFAVPMALLSIIAILVLRQREQTL